MDPAARDDLVMSLAEDAMKTPRRERDNFLQTACQSDPDLYREVSEIVTWEERMGNFLTRPLVEFIDLDALEQIFEPRQLVAGRFEIIRRVGDGGMGIVYEAFDNTRQQRIAIKCPKPGYDDLLPRELKGALDVRHPNVCLVNDIHATNADLGEIRFLTMEFLDGETLAHRLDTGKCEEADAWLIARQLCEGLVAAHRKDILHRDLKPGNVILGRDDDGSARAVITDFGLAIETSDVSELEGGTPNYMAPELWRGGKASPASDVFSLGVILYEIVTGCKPFPALSKENPTFPAPIAPSKLVKNLPRRWDSAILPCLRENPDQRCSAEDVLAALERKPLYRRPEVWVAIAACLVLVVPLTQGIYNFFKPAPYSLVVLPAEASGDLAQRSQGILTEAAKRILQIQSGEATVSVIPPAKAVSKGVTTPEQAAKAFGATHALQVKLLPEGDGVSVEGAIIDLHTMAHVRDYSGHFAANDLADLPGGLAETVGWALHLPRAPQPESIAETAAAPYQAGLKYLALDPADYASAIPQFQEAVRNDPRSPLPLAGMAAAYTRKFQSQRVEHDANVARSWLARAEALDADSPRVRMASGLLHVILGDNSNSLADYQRVEEIEPDNVEALLGSGLAYELQHMVDRAETDYRHAMAAAPGYYKPYMYMGALYFYSGNYSKAAELYQQSIQRAPQNGALYGSLAGAYIAQGQDKEADEVFAHVPPGPESAQVLNNRGAQLAFSHKDREAIPYYERAIQLDPGPAFYWLNLGDSHRRLKHQAEARKAYQRGLTLAQDQVVSNSNSPSARAFLAYLHARLGDTRQARAEIAAAMGSAARDDQVLLTAVETYEVLGDRKRALYAAAKATVQTRHEISRHPDLADLCNDLRFRVLLAQTT